MRRETIYRDLRILAEAGFLAVLEALGARARPRARLERGGIDGGMTFAPTAGIRSVEDSIETT